MASEFMVLEFETLRFTYTIGQRVVHMQASEGFTALQPNDIAEIVWPDQILALPAADQATLTDWLARVSERMDEQEAASRG